MAVKTLAGIDVRAVSVGGLETCIELPTFKLAFDIGRCPPTAAQMARVFFTHAHVDHMGGVAHHLSMRDLLGMAPPEYYVPAANEAAFHALLDAWRRLDRGELPCQVIPVCPGDRLPVGKNLAMHAFKAPHRVTALGYALVRSVERLRPELGSLTGSQIRDLRARGEAVTRVEERVEVAFCGDTLIQVVDREPLVRTARLLILECTFLDGRVGVDRARRTGHVHLDQIVERAHLFENERILLTHFSQRYSPDQIVRLLDERLPPALKERVVPLLPEPPWA